tara:strand:+ start:391 stop:696 length:306 start_codon:yes stop_codon:yes gene_type:complete
MTIRNEELLNKTTIEIVKICNEIYTKVDRSTGDTTDISDADTQLLKVFNLLVDMNQVNLNILHPERNRKVRVCHLVHETTSFGSEDAWITEEFVKHDWSNV